mmetsp:Transcript_81278/g.263592  ORF Transcript_81278/g.263592 Transcript_81278/m.263592 type:complete len:285 (+) Transcript_81278:73-927(+)
MSQLVREGIGRRVRVRIRLQDVVAHVEDDIMVRDRLVRRRAGEVPKVIPGHDEGVFKAALQQEHVDSVGASVHEGHGAEHLALMVHPTAALGDRAQLRDVVGVGVNVRSFEGHLDVGRRALGSRPHVDVSGDDFVQREVPHLTEDRIVKRHFGADRGILAPEVSAAIRALDHAAEPGETRMFAFTGREVETLIPCLRPVPQGVQKSRIVPTFGRCAGAGFDESGVDGLHPIPFGLQSPHPRVLQLLPGRVAASGAGCGLPQHPLLVCDLALTSMPIERAHTPLL